MDVQAIVALGKADRIYADSDGQWYVDIIWDLDMTASLKENPVSRGGLWERIQQPARANPSTQRVLTRRLKGIAAEMEDEPDLKDERERVFAEVVARRGQLMFRKSLLRAYDSRCAVTGEAVVDVLDAAHITPYLGAKSNKVSNGLLLRTDIHTLFDLNLLTIDVDYTIVLSDRLESSDYWSLRGRRIRLPNRRADHPSKPALRKRLTALD